MYLYKFISQLSRESTGLILPPLFQTGLWTPWAFHQHRQDSPRRTLISRPPNYWFTSKYYGRHSTQFVTLITIFVYYVVGESHWFNSFRRIVKLTSLHFKLFLLKQREVRCIKNKVGLHIVVVFEGTPLQFKQTCPLSVLNIVTT